MEMLILLSVIILCVYLFWRWANSSNPDVSANPEADISPQRMPQEETTEASEKDAWEVSFFEADHPVSVRAIIRIDYTDSNGSRTSRDVNVRQFDEHLGGGAIIGHCQLRGATRTFLTSRVNACTDLETGEVIEDLKTFLIERYRNSPEAAAADLLESDYDLMRVLVYVGKADGQFRKAEKEIIFEVCKTVSPSSNLTLAAVEGMLAEIEQLSQVAFNRAISRLSRQSPKVREIALNAIIKIIGTQKSVHPHEQVALDYARSQLS